MPLVDNRRRTVPPPRAPFPASSCLLVLSHARAPPQRNARTEATWRVRHILLSHLNAFFYSFFSSLRPLKACCAAALVVAIEMAVNPGALIFCSTGVTDPELKLA